LVLLLSFFVRFRENYTAQRHDAGWLRL
jgi:hypothetical protein